MAVSRVCAGHRTLIHTPHKGAGLSLCQFRFASSDILARNGADVELKRRARGEGIARSSSRQPWTSHSGHTCALPLLAPSNSCPTWYQERPCQR
eukprot:3826276-Rhodomonas_salina.2